MDLVQVLTLLCGVALFLYGMTLMGDGLAQVSGSKLEPILFRLSGTPLRGILLGTGVTTVIQSSSATSIMAIGFVNAGMMSVRQSIGVTLGAILGTSITGWIICLGYINGPSGLSALLSTSTLTCVIAVIGILFRFYMRRSSKRHLGDILLGFAILMLGMGTMSDAVSPLGQQPWFTGTLSSLTHPLLGILVGAAFTAVLQSASAAVGIIQALSVTGALSFSAALPLLMGISIGASVPVVLSSLGASTNGRRAAAAYPIANICGVIICSVLYYPANALFHFPFVERIMDPFSIALANTVYRLIVLCLLAPCIGLLDTLVQRIVPDRADRIDEPQFHLEERFISHPALAIEQSRSVINSMADVSRRSITSALELLTAYSRDAYEKIEEAEASTDRSEDALGTYLVRITGQELTRQQSRQVSQFLHVLTDFERIADHALNIAQSGKELYEKHLSFSDEALTDLAVLNRAVEEILDLTTRAFAKEDLVLAGQVEPLEEVIDILCDEMKLRHVQRLQRGECRAAQSFLFDDLLTDLERVSDHCSNVAAAILQESTAAYGTHDYMDQIKAKHSPEFDRHFAAYRDQFSL